MNDGPSRRELRDAIDKQRHVILDWEIVAADHRRAAEDADDEKRRAEVHLTELLTLLLEAGGDDDMGPAR